MAVPSRRRREEVQAMQITKKDRRQRRMQTRCGEEKGGSKRVGDGAGVEAGAARHGVAG